jgi:hypothetical protein
MHLESPVARIHAASKELVAWLVTAVTMPNIMPIPQHHHAQSPQCSCAGEEHSLHIRNHLNIQQYHSMVQQVRHLGRRPFLPCASRQPSHFVTAQVQSRAKFQSSAWEVVTRCSNRIAGCRAISEPRHHRSQPMIHVHGLPSHPHSAPTSGTAPQPPPGPFCTEALDWKSAWLSMRASPLHSTQCYSVTRPASHTAGERAVAPLG